MYLTFTGDVTLLAENKDPQELNKVFIQEIEHVGLEISDIKKIDMHFTKQERLHDKRLLKSKNLNRLKNSNTWR